MPRSLRDRLRRLDGPSVSAVASRELESLEKALVGEVREDLGLKARLERLVAAAGRGRQPQRPEAGEGGGTRLEELVQGCRVENEHGEFYLIDESLPLEGFHGGLPLSRFRALAPDSAAIVAGEPGYEGFDLAASVFLDTETTGLAGGTGTAAFLIGIGYVDGDRFRVRQYFMRDYHEEASLLAGLAEELRRFRSVVTYNGRMFDLPLLETRYRLCRQRYPLEQAVHLDLLHPSRRLWKARFGCCRLQTLEAALLGVERHGDVPGEEIPRLYFEYVRRRDARALAQVFRHNHVDVVSLAALSVLACQWVAGGMAEDPRDLLSLGRVYERARLGERSERVYRRALESGDGALRLSALLRLAARLKRAGEHAAAAELWAEATEAGDLGALRELAIHSEHRTRDLAAALTAVERGLEQVAARRTTVPARSVADLHKRRLRLLAKLERQRERRPAHRARLTLSR
jgi:uncharacterized protein YprB with RNaseH-like and TPR domain